jgi:hypothetical protein
MKSLTLTLAALVASTVVAVAASDATKSADTVIIAEESNAVNPGAADTSTGTTTESTTTETTTKTKKDEMNKEGKEGTSN